MRKTLEQFEQSLNNFNLTEKDSKENYFIVFSSTKDNFLINLLDIKEVSSIPSIIEKIKLTKKYVIGVSYINGDIYTLYDFNMMLHNDLTKLGIEAQLILLKTNMLDSHVSLAVSSLDMEATDHYKESDEKAKYDWCDKVFIKNDKKYYLINVKNFISNEMIDKINNV